MGGFPKKLKKGRVQVMQCRHVCGDTTKRSCLKIDFALHKLHNTSPTVGSSPSKPSIMLIRLLVANSIS
jgi:hypothetical protein